MGTLDLAIEGATLFLIAFSIADPVVAVGLLYVGLVYRPYFSNGRQLALAILVTFVAFAAGTALSIGALQSVLTAYILSQLPVSAFTAGIIFLFAQGMVKQEHLLAELTVGKNRYQSLVESIPGVILTSTADGILRYASPQIESLIGVNVDDIQDDKWATIVCQFVHPDDRSDVFEKLERAVSKGEPISLECRAIQASGETIWVHLERRLVDDGSPDAPFW